jgi:site-specific DNA-methyltransferase (cytosine-N4-specific)
MNFQVLRSRSVGPLFGSGYEALHDIQWHFADREVQSELESIHPYPAKFIPEIPGSVLDLMPPAAGTAVFDPFVGSGTTLVVAQKRGIPSIGVDLNPIACLISRVKTGNFAGDLEAAGEDVVHLAVRRQVHFLPNIPNLDHWFLRSVQDAVARLVGAIDASSPVHQEALCLALSSILVRVSNQDSDTRYAAIEKNIGCQQVYAAFLAACRKIGSALSQRDYPLAPATVIERDTLTLTPPDIPMKVGAVITSPPYPNAYEYWLYHKYRMWWLGHDPLAVKSREIGARAHFFKTNHHTADHFVDQMHQTFQLISDVLMPGGYACFVIGRSKIHGRLVDNAAILERAAARFGFVPVFRTERVIAATRKSFNLSHANIKTETILLLARS